jgi:agmatine deiminase
MPAEWEEHEATWLAWPHNSDDWPGKLTTIPWVYGEIVRKLCPGETIRIIVNSKAHESSARRVLKRVGVDFSRIEFFHFPTDRGWTRDSGPMFVRHDEPPREVAVNDFQFNGWARYKNWKKDAKIHARAARALRLRLFHAQVSGKPFVLEGGAIDVNGRGTLLTTEECLLDQETQVRNPGLSREDVEQALRNWLGVSKILWLGRGIAGDDTHGHIDDLARFVNERTIVVCEEKNPLDVNYRPLNENQERLRGMRLEDGSRPEVVTLPMPGRLFFDGTRLPASYANFYFANEAVLVPTFNDPNDRIALGILSELIPDRPVVGIHAVDLVLGFGTLHCMTQQQPAV